MRAKLHLAFEGSEQDLSFGENVDVLTGIAAAKQGAARVDALRAESPGNVIQFPVGKAIEDVDPLQIVEHLPDPTLLPVPQESDRGRGLAEESTTGIDCAVETLKRHPADYCPHSEPAGFPTFHRRRNDVDGYRRQQRSGTESRQQSEEEIGRLPETRSYSAEPQRRRGYHAKCECSQDFGHGVMLARTACAVSLARQCRASRHVSALSVVLHSPPMTTPQPSPQYLRRELGVFGATLLGLGSIVGTGVFVSIGIAADITGASVALAVGLAAFVAAFNGSSSAQLAAAHPVSGGTYEYGYQFLNPTLGFVAGWMFLLAKSASAATAALGFSGYTLNLFEQDDGWLVPMAVLAVVAIVLIVLAGIRFSSQVNMVIVSVTILALGIFAVVAAGDFGASKFTPFLGGDEGSVLGFFEATALMFVAYTGYGRIATLGEEVHHPRRTIPLAIGMTLLVTAIVYIAVAVTAVGAVGADRFADLTESTAAPLEAIARALDQPAVASVVAVGAVTAMLGVLLNLILGLSRVLMAMGRRSDMPAATARLDAAGKTPVIAVIVIGLIVGCLALIGDVRTTWSFSAFTVLIYYALTNAAALRLPRDQRFLPRWLAWAGLASCLFLVAFIDPGIWVSGVVVLVGGLLWHQVARRMTGPAQD